MWVQLLVSLSLATFAGAQQFEGSGGVRSCGTNSSSQGLPLISDLKRRILGDHSVEKRAKNCGLAFYCAANDVCCLDVGYTCCSLTICCAPGYACAGTTCVRDVV